MILCVGCFWLGRSVYYVYVIQALSQIIMPLNQGGKKIAICETTASGIVCENPNGVLFWL